MRSKFYGFFIRLISNVNVFQFLLENFIDT